MTASPLTSRHLKVLAAAPIGIEDVSTGDPERGVRYRFDGVDGRLARSLWLRGLLEHRALNPHNHREGGLLELTDTGRAALAAATPDARRPA